MQKLTEEQQKLMDDMGFKGQRLVGGVFILIALLLVGLNVFFRFKDSHKYDDYVYTTGTVVDYIVSKTPRVGRRGSTYSSDYSIKVEYYVGDYEKPLTISDSDSAYEFINYGDTVRVYYDEENPGTAFLAKYDTLTGLYLPAEKNYYIPLYIAIFPTIIGIYLIIDFQKARKKALKNELKPRKKVVCSTDPDYDNNFHQLVRMSNYKRSWSGFWIAGSLFYLFTMFMGVMIIYSTLKDHPDDSFSPIVVACFMMLLGNAMLVGVIISVRYIDRRKKAFIAGFMADEATAVYRDREQAAEILWKLVKSYMEKETVFSRFKLEYNRDWLETYREYLDKM